jgi:ATP-binding cassette subfamily F protein uup
VILVDAAGVTLRRPDRTLLSDVSLTIRDGERLGIVGLNGCGKSTLIKVLAGQVAPDEGVVRTGRDTTVAWLEQDPTFPAGTVRSVAGDGWEAAAVLDHVGLTAHLDADVTTLSGGQRRRLALARALLATTGSPSDLLFLDEPTNHLDVDAIEWLEGRLAKFRGGLVLVTHDRHLLDAATDRVLELDRGKAYLHVATGEHGGSGYRAYLEGRERREELAAETEKTRQNLARTELAWLRRGAPARTSKPKARLDAAKALVNARPEAAARSGSLDLSSLGSARLGSKVVELHGVGHRYGDDAAWLFRDVEVTIEPGDRLGIVGPNGTGKSTLLDIVAGRTAPAAGTVEVGATVSVGYLDQRGVTLDPNQRVRDAVAGPDRTPDHEDARLMDRFWFVGETQWARIGELSGGERRRLQLVLTLARKPNVLLLDEPTNDLDLDTLRALEDLLEDWPGAVVVVSHDRAFLERTVDQVLAMEPGRPTGLVRGGYAGWLEERRRRSAPAPAPAAPPSTTGTVSPPVPQPTAPRKRSGNTLVRLLEKAEKRLEEATAHRDAIAARLAAGVTDHAELTRLSHDLAEADAEVTAAEDAWLELAD